LEVKLRQRPMVRILEPERDFLDEMVVMQVGFVTRHPELRSKGIASHEVAERYYDLTERDPSEKALDRMTTYANLRLQAALRDQRVARLLREAKQRLRHRPKANEGERFDLVGDIGDEARKIVESEIEKELK